MTPTLYKKLRETKAMIKQIINDDVSAGAKPADSAAKLMSNDEADTIKWILAETVKACDWDGRYSRLTKEWARSLFVPVLSEENGEQYGRIDGPHPAHINQVIEAIIKQ